MYSFKASGNYSNLTITGFNLCSGFSEYHNKKMRFNQV